MGGNLRVDLSITFYNYKVDLLGRRSITDPLKWDVTGESCEID